jgi:hypothetical protein
LRARGRVVRVIELTGRRPKANAAVLAGVADGTKIERDPARAEILVTEPGGYRLVL